MKIHRSRSYEKDLVPIKISVESAENESSVISTHKYKRTIIICTNNQCFHFIIINKSILTNEKKTIN